MNDRLDRWYAGSSDDMFTVGPCATEQAAAEEYIRENPDETDGFYTGIGHAHELVLHGDDIVELAIAECCIENWDNRLTSKALDQLGREVTAFFKDWCRQHHLKNPIELIDPRSHWEIFRGKPHRVGDAT